MFEPLDIEASAPIALTMVLAFAFGTWRGRGVSRRACLFLLGVTATCVAGVYASRGPNGLAVVGALTLFGALGLVGPALFARRVPAAALSAAILTLLVFAGTGVYLYGACALFFVCV